MGLSWLTEVWFIIPRPTAPSLMFCEPCLYYLAQGWMPHFSILSFAADDFILVFGRPSSPIIGNASCYGLPFELSNFQQTDYACVETEGFL